MNDASYAFMIELPGSTVEQAIAEVKTALATQGFGVLTDIDVQATLQSKLGAAFRSYHILGACNPQLAKRALEVDDQVGLLLPCNVVVQEAPRGGSLVSILDPRAMFRVISNHEIEPIVAEAEDRLRRVATTLEVTHGNARA